MKVEEKNLKKNDAWLVIDKETKALPVPGVGVLMSYRDMRPTIVNGVCVIQNVVIENPIIQSPDAVSVMNVKFRQLVSADSLPSDSQAKPGSLLTFEMPAGVDPNLAAKGVKP